MNKYIISEKVKNDYNIPDTDAEKSLANITESDVVKYVKSGGHDDFGMEDEEVITRAMDILAKHNESPEGLLPALMDKLLNDDCVEDVLNEVGDMASEVYRKQRERRDKVYNHSIEERCDALIFDKDEPLIGVTVGEFLNAVNKSYPDDEGDMKTWEDNSLVTAVRYNLDSSGLLYDLDVNIAQTAFNERGPVTKKK